MPDYARIAYEAYAAHTGGKSLVSGAPLPTWENLKPEIRAAWDAATQAVLRSMRGGDVENIP